MPSGAANGTLSLLDCEYSALTVDRAQHHAGEHGRAATLGIDNMRGLVGYDFVSGLAVNHDRNLVAHRPRRHEDRRLLAQHICNHFAKPVGRRILTALLIADRRTCHRLSHRRGRTCLGIAIKVDIDIRHHQILVSRNRSRRLRFIQQYVEKAHDVSHM